MLLLLEGGGVVQLDMRTASNERGGQLVWKLVNYQQSSAEIKRISLPPPPHRSTSTAHINSVLPSSNPESGAVEIRSRSRRPDARGARHREDVEGVYGVSRQVPRDAQACVCDGGQ